MNFYARTGRYFPRRTLNLLRTLRDGLPLHYQTIAGRLSEAANLTGARLTNCQRQGLVHRVADIGPGWYQITATGLRRLSWLEANDPGV